MWRLYQQVFRSAGLSVPEAIPPVAIHPSLRVTFERLHPELTQPKPGRLRLGIAPFASTRAKTYDPELMQEALRLIEESERFEIFLFGGQPTARTSTPSLGGSTSRTSSSSSLRWTL